MQLLFHLRRLLSYDLIQKTMMSAYTDQQNPTELLKANHTIFQKIIHIVQAITNQQNYTLIEMLIN